MPKWLKRALTAAITLLLLLIFLPVLLPWVDRSLSEMRAFCSKWFGPDGLIVVDSPEVYTRERLVNDRLQEGAWLRKQLQVTEEQLTEFRSLSGFWNETATHALVAGAGIGIPDERPKLFPPAKGYGRPPDEMKLRLKPGATADGEPPAALPETRDLAASQAKVQQEVPTADLFRDMNAFRQDVRAELMQTELDDRHDIAGNTMYRLTFDTTIIAGDRNDKLAAVVVDLKEAPVGELTKKDYEDLYIEWRKETQLLVGKAVDSLVDLITSGEFKIRQPDTWYDLYKFLESKICTVANAECATFLRDNSNKYVDIIKNIAEAKKSSYEDHVKNKIHQLENEDVRPQSVPFQDFEDYCLGMPRDALT